MLAWRVDTIYDQNQIIRDKEDIDGLSELSQHTPHFAPVLGKLIGKLEGRAIKIGRSPKVSDIPIRGVPVKTSPSFSSTV